jgi:hypothetical protein
MRAMRVNASRKRMHEPATPEQRLVRGVDDRVDVQRRDIGFDDVDIRHACSMSR